MILNKILVILFLYKFLLIQKNKLIINKFNYFNNITF